MLPSVPVPLSNSEPAVTVVPPLYVLSPVSVMEFAPLFEMEPMPVITLSTVVFTPLP